MDAAWETLGIGPTDDVGTIRKAYAARLRVTRPDEDAEGYQRLREAYDAALNAARPREPQATSGGTTDAAVVLAESVVAEADSTPSVAANSSDVPDPVDPAELARSLYASWREIGDTEIVRAWPAIRQALDAVPIAQRAETALWCAELVLQEPDLPFELVDALADYFDWGRDFRSEQLLGSERAHRLREHLNERGLLNARSAELRARFGDLLVLAGPAELAGTSMLRRWRLWLQALLAPPQARCLLEATPASQLRALGIDVPAQLRIASAFDAAGTGAFALMALVASLLPGPPGSSWQVSATLTITAGMLLWGSIPSLLNWLARLRGYAWEGGRLSPWFDRWSVQPRFLTAAAAPFLAALAISTLGLDDAGHFSNGWLAVGYLALMIFGVWLAWPLGHPWQAVAAPLALAAWISIAPAVENHGGGSTAAALVGLWLLASHALLARCHHPILAAYRSPLLWLVPRTPWGWLVLVLGIKVWVALALLAAVVTLPLSFFVASIFIGPRIPAAALWIGICAGTAGVLSDLPLAVLPAAGILLLELIGLQSLASAFWKRGRKQPAQTGSG